MQNRLLLLAIGILLLGVTYTTASNDTDTVIDVIAKIAKYAGADKKEVEENAALAKKTVVVVEKLIQHLSSEKSMKAFQKLSNALAVAGPIAMAATMFISIGFAIAGGSTESAEVAAINKGFENMDRRLNTIENTLDEIKNLIRLSSAQVGYLDVCNTIDNVYMEWNSFADSKNPSAVEKEEFLLQYAKYNFAALNLWRGMVPSGGNALAFDLLEIYKAQTNCNPMKLQMFCISMTSYINKGLMVEGAYHGMKNLTDKLQRLKTDWEDRMKQLDAKCLAVTQECQKAWKPLAEDTAKKTYDKFATADNAKLANELYNALSEHLPQRNWAVWVYNDATGFDEHAYTTYDPIEIWNKNGKDVTIVGFDEEAVKYSESAVSKSLEALLKEASETRTCQNKGEYARDRPNVLSKKLVSLLQDKEGQKLMASYGVISSKNPAFKAKDGRFILKKVRTYCVDPEVQLYFFQ